MIEQNNPPLVHPTAEVHPSATIGPGTRIWHQAQIREDACIGAHCVISKGVYIDAGVKIGDRVKIQNGVSVYRGVVLEDDAFVGPNAAFTNDLMPRSFSADWDVVPTYVKQGASIGANATIVCGVTLGPYSMVAAGSTVSTDVPPHGLVIGCPARVVCYICRRGHRMKPAAANGYTSTHHCARCRETLTVTFEWAQEPKPMHG